MRKKRFLYKFNSKCLLKNVIILINFTTQRTFHHHHMSFPSQTYRSMTDGGALLCCHFLSIE